MIERVPKWVADKWPGAKGRLCNTNFSNKDAEWWYIGTSLDELTAYLNGMLHHPYWRVDTHNNVIEPLGQNGERA